jgi:transposase
MRTLQLTREISSDVIKEKMQSAPTVSDFKRWQIIYSINNYIVDADYLSDITGYSKANVYAIVQQFNGSTEADVTSKQKGGRRRELMSIEEERQLMKSLESMALEGQILSGKDVRKIIEQKINKSVSDDYIWDLFKRNGWTKHSPRPHHPNKNIEKQEEFKKNSKTIWLPLKMILNQV